MAWAWWLSVPIVATALAALWVWWAERRARPPGPLDTPESMQAHRDYLDALTVPARGTHRVGADRPSD
ncbi:MAG: hypothetical protein ABI301_05990 [Jatrophihabitantaceae bacterium]